VLRRLADHAIARLHPDASRAEQPYVALFDAVVGAQASLVARWMLVGFVHGVMNTDNVTISGETIDYGPCAFMDAHDPATVFSSIDLDGRYAYGNQPGITHWNLARLAEAMLTLVDEDVAHAVEQLGPVLATFPDRYQAAWRSGMRAKVGLAAGAGDALVDEVVDELPGVLHASGADHTGAFRALAESLRGDDAAFDAATGGARAARDWAARWRALVDTSGEPRLDVADQMDTVNPVYVPRNHLVEEALSAATEGDRSLVEQLVEVVRSPFDRRAGSERYEAPAPSSFGRYRTFCGT
jgi:uncharacterized protein YdiU (UPF0061 family)